MFNKIHFSATAASISAVTVFAVIGFVGKILYDILVVKDYSDVFQSGLAILGLLGVHLVPPSPPTPTPSVNFVN